MPFPTITIIAIIALTLVQIIWSAVNVGAATNNRSIGLRTGLGLFGWLIVVAFLAHTNFFFRDGSPVYLIVFPILIPVVVGALLLTLPSFRSMIGNMSQRMIIAPHFLRMIGVSFLVLANRGYLPAKFAVPAGYGDIAIAAAVPVVLYLITTKHRWAWQAILIWNILGLIDLASALTQGPANIPNFLLSIEPPYALNYFILIPTFAVPIFLITHIYSLYKLATERSESGY